MGFYRQVSKGNVALLPRVPALTFRGITHLEKFAYTLQVHDVVS